jgi:hypothetical protein
VEEVIVVVSSDINMTLFGFVVKFVIAFSVEQQKDREGSGRCLV